jgi:hypothetical protein
MLIELKKLDMLLFSQELIPHLIVIAALNAVGLETVSERRLWKETTHHVAELIARHLRRFVKKPNHDLFPLVQQLGIETNTLAESVVFSGDFINNYTLQDIAYTYRTILSVLPIAVDYIAAWEDFSNHSKNDLIETIVTKTLHLSLLLGVGRATLFHATIPMLILRSILNQLCSILRQGIANATAPTKNRVASEGLDRKAFEEMALADKFNALSDDHSLKTEEGYKICMALQKRMSDVLECCDLSEDYQTYCDHLCKQKMDTKYKLKALKSFCSAVQSVSQIVGKGWAKCVCDSEQTLQNCTKLQKKDKKHVLKYIKRNGQALQVVQTQFKNDPSFLIIAAKANLKNCLTLKSDNSIPDPLCVAKDPPVKYSLSKVKQNQDVMLQLISIDYRSYT